MKETCTVTSSSRLERHRRKRRAKLGSSARLWKRSQERYENLDDGEGEQPQETSFDSASTEELFHPLHDEPMVEDMDCEDFLSFAFIHQDSESADAALDLLPRPVTPDFMQFAPLDLDVSPSSPAKFISEPTPGATKHKKTLRFADDLGKPLTDVHYVETMYSIQDLKWIRAIVLLLNSKKRKFEFIHVSYNMEERTSIADILKQLPNMATDDDLKSQGYTGLCRTTEFGRELINTVSIQGYDLQRDEILVAIMKGVSGKSQLNIAQPLLENKKILRAVRVVLRRPCFVFCRGSLILTFFLGFLGQASKGTGPSGQEARVERQYPKARKG